MKSEIPINNYESFLRAKETLEKELQFHKFAISANVKKDLKAIAVVKILSLAINVFYKTRFVKGISNIFYLKSLSKILLKSVLSNIVFRKK